jgi:hypothetical protein
VLAVVWKCGDYRAVLPVPVSISEVRGTPNRRPADYLLATARTGGVIARVRSGLRTTESRACLACGYAGIIDGYDRVAVEKGSWTGADFFKVAGLPGPVLVTPRVASVCADAGLTTVCRLIPDECYSL